jgi:hypothetical protein
VLEVVGKDIISGNMGFIGTDSDRLYRMGAAEKTKDITVTGNPAVLDNATGKPFRDLHIYGRSEQVTTTGAQLLDLDAMELAQGTGATIERLDDGGFLINGTPKVAYEQYIRGFKLDIEPGTYYISGGKYSAGCVVAQIKIVNADGTKKYYNNKKFDISGTEKEVSVSAQTTTTDPIDNYKVYPMLSKGSTALPFEPYTGGKPSPSPDYPQEIVSAGEDGNIGVEVHGKNLWHGGDFEVSVGHSPTGFAFAPQDLVDKVKALPNDTYSFSYKPIGSGNTGTNIGKVSLIQEDGLQIDLGETITLTNEVRNKIVKIGVYGYLNQTNKITKLQIERSHEPTDYEPYRIPQIFTISTNLPGIPVDSGGNYTDEQGQQWICDEVDFGRGVYVQRIGILILDDKSSIRSVSKWDNAHLDVVQPYRVDGVAMIKRKVICDRLPSVEGREAWDLDIEMVGGVWFTDGTGFYLDFYIKNQRLGTTKDTSPDDATTAVLKWLKDNPLSCKYALATPIETPLTASEIAAYKSLRTYRGTTIVEARDKAGISVTYKRNAKTSNISAEKKIEESEKKEYDES